MMQPLDRHSGNPLADQARLYRAVLFNLIIAGTDAHARNFALIYPPAAGLPRLAPLYDMNSMYSYATQRRDMRGWLRIAGHYKLHKIAREHLVRRIDGCHLRARDAVRRYRRDASGYRRMRREYRQPIRAVASHRPYRRNGSAGNPECA